MALVYDRGDIAPASVPALTQTHRAITFPPYAGYDGSSSLAGPTTGEAISVKCDPGRFDKPWYATVSNAVFTGIASAVDQNFFCPVSIVVAFDGGPVAATVIGNLYFKYVIEFIEPIAPTMNT
jgi:hypothetical protein